MNDRELLEMAAKAAGYVVVDGHVHERNGGRLKFKPFQDDGDALRLAVKLGLDIFTRNIHNPCNEKEQHTCVQLAWDDSLDMAATASERHGDDQYAATRRAIVRAAAEIGKAMP